MVNGIICDFTEFYNKYPSIDDVKSNYNFKYCDLVSDDDIKNIINNVIKIDEETFLNRHNWLRENKKNYIGFRAIDENGMKFISNDDICRKLGTRLLR